MAALFQNPLNRPTWRQRFRAQLAERSALASVFLVGVFTGLLLFMPLMPYEIPDSAASLLGAFLGAAMAVSSAAWIASAKERKHAAALKKATLEAIGFIFVRYGLILVNAEGQTSPGILFPTLSQSLVGFVSDCKQAKEGLEAMHDAYVGNPSHALAYVQLQRQLSNMIEAAEYLNDVLQGNIQHTTADGARVKANAGFETPHIVKRMKNAMDMVQRTLTWIS